MTKSHICLGLTCLSLGLIACAEQSELLEISSGQAALTAAENSERALQGVIDAADFLAASTSLAGALSAFEGPSDDCVTSGACEPGGECVQVEVECTSDEVGEADLEEARQELRESAQELVELLRDRILIEENLEAETSTSATYRIGADVLCPTNDEVVVFGGSGGGEPELDEECVAEVTRLAPRLVLTSPSEGDIDVTLQLGAERHEPLTLALYHNSLGVRLDLGESLALARDLGDDEGLEGIQKLAGVLELRLVENAARDYSLEFYVLEALEAEVDANGDTLSASLGASSPAWNVRVNGNSETLSAGIDLAALKLVGPLRAFAGSFGDEDVDDDGSGFGDLEDAPLGERQTRDYTGVLDLFLAGLSGTVSYTANTDVLSIDNLGFGDSTSTLKHDGNTLLALDLNPNAGRRVNLSVSSNDSGTSIRITPSFEMKLQLAFHYVADQFENLADYLLDDTLRVWFDGDAPELRVSDEQLAVASGTLHIESTADAAVSLSVPAGMCLGAAEESDGGEESEESEAEHPLVSLEAIACE